MSYTALYRKFRPDTFDDVKGQDVIVKTLRNQIISGNLSHAYLFSGTRGTGKTTLAKIMAKAVNCTNLNNGNPCNECDSCKSINQSASLDVVEIDAASNNGVDDIRKIKEEIAYAPVDKKFKVYIIDEAHMLSNPAKNALLKTLEEPPEYVIFILATTEAHALPTTITSRCQKYYFKRISIDTITKRLEELMQIQNQDVEDRALRYIAKLADGSMRDALSLLDRCLAFYVDEKLTYDKVLEALGTIDSASFSKLAKLVIERNINETLSTINNMLNDGREINQLLSDFIWYLRNILIVSGTDNVGDALDMSDDNIEELRKLSNMISSDELIKYINILSDTSDKMRYSTQKRVLLEIAFVKLIVSESISQTGSQTSSEPSTNQTNNFNTDEIKKIVDVYLKQKLPTLKLESNNNNSETKSKPQMPQALDEDIKEIVRNYRKLCQTMGAPINSYLESTKVSLGKNNDLVIVAPNDVIFGYVDGKINEIINYFSTKLQKQVLIHVEKLDKESSFEDSYIDLESFINMDIEEEN